MILELKMNIKKGEKKWKHVKTCGKDSKDLQLSKKRS